MTELEKQDLGISETRAGDVSWAKPDLPRPSQERLEAPSSWVTVCNTSNEQTHIVLDRFMLGHELHPGQSANMEMLDSDVEYFIERRKPRTVNRIVNNTINAQTVRHPVEIRDEFGKPLLAKDEDVAVAPVRKVIRR